MICSCCGKPYVPKSVRAAEAIKADPEKSDRTIASETGVNKSEVSRVRQTTVPDGTVGQPPETTTLQGLVGPDGVTRRQGLDGKWRKLPEKKPEAEEAEQKRRQKQFIERAKAAAKMGSYEGPIDSEMQEAAATVADAWVPYAGNNRKWKTQGAGYADLLSHTNKLEDRNRVLTAALNAKEAQEGRNWPADMKPRQTKKRDDCLRNIAGWQRDLEQLYGEVTGQPSWRVELITKDGVRIGNGARFGTRGEAEQYGQAIIRNDGGGQFEILPCEHETANMQFVGTDLRFSHGDCVLLNWHPLGAAARP
jgi:hypothetical protein